MKLTYKEILTHIRPTSFLSYLDNKVAAYFVYGLQNLPVSANLISSFSFFLVLLAALSLLVFKMKILFILFLMIAYTFDNVDGIWARVKNQTSEFGKFYDGFLDSAKLFVVDITFILFYFQKIHYYINDTKILVLFVSTYFILWNLYSLSYIESNLSSKTSGKAFNLTSFTNGAARFIIIFPLVIYFEKLMIFYFLASFGMFLFKVTGFLVKRYNYHTKTN